MDAVALFASAFAAATLLPLSSDAVRAAIRVAGGHEAWFLLAVATAGNTLGSALNWALGRWALHWQDRRWFPVKPDALARASAWFGRWGLWTLPFAWVPVVGDPLTFVAGALRTRFDVFVLLVALGKAARYAVVLLATDAVTA
jgi:membrane protein YqaA with SNARE-associated domain